MNNGCYCVLDDDKDFLLIAKKELTKYLPEIEDGLFTSEPQAAIDYAKRNKPTIYVIDITLSGSLSGRDVFQKISSVAKNIRTIFISGNENFLSNDDVRAQVLAERSLDLLEKPVKWHEMAIKIKNNMELLLYQCQLEELVAERTQQLIHTDRLATVGTMVSSIIHEINSPLTFIKSNQEICRYAYSKVKEATSDENVLSVFDKLINPSVSDSLKGIDQIEDLLNSFKRFYKKDTAVYEVDFPSLLEEVKNLTSYSIRKNNINFSCKIKNGVPAKIKCKKQELIQVITNIINNAVDALEESAERNKKLTVTVSDDEAMVHIVIANNGPAIPKENIDRIFESFFTTKSKEKGTGLGLAISRQILKFMSGSLTVENKSAAHPTVDFIISIPRNYK